jgi:hypothetical protein
MIDKTYAIDFHHSHLLTMTLGVMHANHQNTTNQCQSITMHMNTKTNYMHDFELILSNYSCMY